MLTSVVSHSRPENREFSTAVQRIATAAASSLSGQQGLLSLQNFSVAIRLHETGDCGKPAVRRFLTEALSRAPTMPFDIDSLKYG